MPRLSDLTNDGHYCYGCGAKMTAPEPPCQQLCATCITMLDEIEAYMQDIEISASTSYKDEEGNASLDMLDDLEF